MLPDISVVIPTRNRPALVTRAVHSALSQTYRNLEVVVVIDGPDPATETALAEIGDARLRVVTVPKQAGAPNARNAGVREARGAWTALLDDDDEWHPEKLAVQLELGRNAGVKTPIVISRLAMRTPRADLVMPRRLPDPGEPLCEYLTVRRGLFHGDGFIQTSTILAPTALLRRVPFDVTVPRCQELDWALRALDHDDVDLVIAPDPLVIWHADENRARISSGSPWRRMLDWLRSHQERLTPRAYAALAMSVVSSMAATTRSLKVFRLLLTEARRHGRPHLIDYVTYLQIWLLPPDLRRRLRDLIKGSRPAPEPLPETPPVTAQSEPVRAQPA
jgi:glycosyltransferase involved in cell wall biosynthesis